MPVNEGVRIDVDGLKELRRAVKNADQAMGKEVGQAGKKAAAYLVPFIKDKVPVRTGAARASVRAVVSYGGGGIRAGGPKAPYYPWLDFGGRVGIDDSVSRNFVREGRYIYPTLGEHRDEVVEQYVDMVNDILRKVDLK